MTEFNLNNQYTLPLAHQGVQPSFSQNSPQFTPNMQGVPPAMQGLDYDTLRMQAENKAKDNAVAQAVKNYNVMEHPGELLKNFFLSLAMSVGFTGATNWLMNSKAQDLNMSNAKNYTQTRLYKAGEYLDNTALGQSLSKSSSKVSGFFSRMGKYVPQAFKDIFAKMSMGSLAVWDKQGMYSLGKSAEALNEMVEYVSKVPKDKIVELFKHKPDVSKEIIKVLDDFQRGKIRGPIAYKKIAHYFDDIPADKLAKLNLPTKFTAAIGVKTDINTALNKARFFSGKASGPLGKFLQKVTSLVGEASGGGVLGGKMALFMNSVGLMTGFNAASEAQKGDKLKAFMEDYIGFTLGSYVMSFFVGTWFNKFLGVSELGMDQQKLKAVASKMGLDVSAGRVQDAVIAYNKEFIKVRKLRNIQEQLRNNKMSADKALAKLRSLNINVDAVGKDSGSILNLINTNLAGKDAKYFENIRKDLKGVMKTNLTLKNVFNGKVGVLEYLVKKPLSVVGRVLSVGRYDLMHGNKSSVKSILKATKRIGGGVGRAALVMFVLVEPFRIGAMKFSHMIFGKPKNSALDEGKEKNEPTPDAEQLKQLEALQEQLGRAQAQTPNGQNNVQWAQSDTNILNKMLKEKGNSGVQDAAPIAASSIAATEVAPKVDNNINSDTAPELKRTYIPSPMPSEYATKKDPREAAVEQAILKAEAAERAAQTFLARGV